MTKTGAAAFPHLFSPLKINGVVLNNRIVFGAHTANMAERGMPGARHRAYYLERAIGGAGMIVVEPMPVHPTAVLTAGNFLPDSDRVIPHFRRITEACRHHGTVMLQQLYHVGQHGDADNSHMPNWSASGLPSWHNSDGGHQASEAEIEEVIAGFVAAADRARQGGFQGVEIFAAYHAFVDQFWNPWSNRRDDRWGGSFDNRMRLSEEILSRIRKKCGAGFVIGLAVSLDALAPTALNVEDLQEIARWHDERGLMDYITCGTGSYFRNQPIIPNSLHDAMLGPPAAARLKQAVKHARVQAESHIQTAANAERVIAEGMADLCSLVRAQIADPHLANKARNGEADRIRPCISCNQLCIGRRYRDYWISCMVNPSAGREAEWRGDRPPATRQRRRVAVIGAGPAGLEAAWTGAMRGHDVTLVERSGSIGGQWRLAGTVPSRERILDHLRWYEQELDRLGVDVWLDTEADCDLIEAEDFDEIVVATGALPPASGFQRALPQVDELPGADAANVHAYQAILSGEALAGARVLVLDDLHGWRAAGTALYLAETGHQVTIMTAKPFIASELVNSGADGPLRRRFARAGGRMLTETALLGWAAPGNEGSLAGFRDLLTGQEFEQRFDTLVLATVGTVNDRLARELEQAGLGGMMRMIGDCVAPRKASAAFHEGRKAGLAL